MPKFLDSIGDAASNIGKVVSNVDKALTNQSLPQEQGFITSAIPSADGNGLPSSKVASGRRGQVNRQLIHWFVPEVGIVKMYVNPESIQYTFKKIITKEKTKGGFTLQYWGEELPTLRINGTTGSSGVEGINVLYEVYRAEQLTFDPIALSISANNSVSGLNNLVNQAAQNLGGLGGSIASATTGIMGLNPQTANILPNNIQSLAQLAFTVEMYYMGWVFRGYFEGFNFTESVNKLGMFDYNFDFIVTQKRGYRLNYMPWHRSAIDGPSNNSQDGGIPLSFSGSGNNNNIKPR